MARGEKLESLGRLAGAVAHDFKNLLAVVNGFVRLAIRKTVDDQVLDFLGEARTACDRATTLSQQLLTFARSSEPVLERFDLAEVVEEMEAIILQAIGTSIELRTDVTDDHLEIVGDRSQLEQVLLNLAVNARDAMPDGGTISVALSTTFIDEGYLLKHPAAALRPGRYVRFVVSDTGTGMSAEVARRVFEPFFSTKPKNAGTGLGLATVYGIVSQMKGHIEVESEIDRGTRFHIVIPAADQPAQPKAKLTPGAHVLVVDDNEKLRGLICQVLESGGYGAVGVATAADALDVLSRDDHPEVAIVDLVLPDASGWRVVERALEFTPPVRCVLMSGYSIAGLEHRAGGAPVTFLHKPFGDVELLAAIQPDAASAHLATDTA
jgi:CheY-like chemotaxis protein